MGSDTISNDGVERNPGRPPKMRELGQIYLSRRPCGPQLKRIGVRIAGYLNDSQRN
jgi:hypothetical protein